jgi:transglutaminase-like putative cysteine protease
MIRISIAAYPRMKVFKPLPRRLTRSLSLVMLVAWVASMAVLVNRSYLQASPANLATDLARYGSTAVWRGVYYRGEKIGFTVSQTVRTDTGFELQEDGRLQMLLLGQDSAATLHTTARVDQNFALRSFEFSLDPGTGPIKVTGTVGEQGPPHILHIAITSSGSTRTEERSLPQPPIMSLNLSRVLASRGITPGSRYEWAVFDPATLRNAPVEVVVGRREVVRGTDGGIVPAFRVEMTFQGLMTTSWITDTGDVIKEESPLGLMTVREPRERAQGLAVPGRVQADLLQMSAVVPAMRQRIDEPRAVRLLRMRVEGVELSNPDLSGAGQRVDDGVLEIRDAQLLSAGPADVDVARYLNPEPLIESDAPEIRAEAELAVRGVEGARARAERLTRYVNALLDKKPTVSLPSAREVLRTKVGDCNEHTALYVAMARAIGIPARIAVGLVYVRGVQGAFYYHAWPEVYLDEGGGRGLWLPVDPTFNEFPADATHLRLARGGLDKQTAIIPLLGRLKITVLDLELDPSVTPVLVGRAEAGLPPLPVSVAPARAGACRCDR